MAKDPTAREAIGLHKLARQLRASAAETNDANFVGLFLSAAMALEARADKAPPLMEHNRRTSRS
jgi:hypothetical protein